MAWEGKMAGAILGGALGGPLGVLIGAGIGHAIDRMTEKSRESGDAGYTQGSQPYGSGSAGGFGPSPQESNSLRIAYGVAAFLAYVARADGHFDPLERQLIIEISTDLLEKSGGNVHAFKKDRWEHLLDEAMRDTGVPREIIYTARSNSQFRKTLLIFAWRVAARDSRVTQEEVAWISRIAIEMGGTMEEVEYSSTPYYRANGTNGNAATAAKTLGVSVNASDDEVKSAYRKASLKYHPDRHPSATESEIKELSHKFSEITNAYKVLSEGSREAALFALEANTHSVVQPMSGEIVVCFICGTKSKLPDVHYHSSSRCPKCQALLLHEKEVAQAFSG